MYRIELAPGEETVFRTIDELAVAVRNGLVTSRARIYHNASQKWLPIEFHPHYKNALKLPPSRPDARVPDRTGPLNFAVARADEPETPTAVEAEAAVVEEPLAPPRAVPPMAVPPVVPSPTLKLPTTWTPEITSPEIRSPEIASPKIPSPEIRSREITDPEITDSDITYPEFARAVPPAPGQASSAKRSRRPLHLAGAAAALALGVYALMSAFSPSRGDAASTRAIADRPAMPQADSLHADAQPPDAPRAEATRVDSEAATPPAAAQVKPAGTHPRAPAHVAMTEPASSGFAPALESRAIVSTSPATVRAAALKDSTIAPAPAALDMAVPALPGAESLVATPRPQGDSALKRILRAVNGGKDAPQRR